MQFIHSSHQRHHRSMKQVSWKRNEWYASCPGMFRDRRAPRIVSARPRVTICCCPSIILAIPQSLASLPLILRGCTLWGSKNGILYVLIYVHHNVDGSLSWFKWILHETLNGGFEFAAQEIYSLSSRHEIDFETLYLFTGTRLRNEWFFSWISLLQLRNVHPREESTIYRITNKNS